VFYDKDTTQAQWVEWMEQEIAYRKAEGDECYYDDMLDGSEIVIPIICSMDGHKYLLWDGHHRVGSSAMINRLTLRAVIGTPI
jgi:hypothetical protein